jgi:addiction module HigA family antidote
MAAPPGDASGALAVSRPALSSLLNGRSSLSPEIALRIEKACGPKMNALLRMQTSYDIAQARRSAHRIQMKPYRTA